MKKITLVDYKSNRTKTTKSWLGLLSFCMLLLVGQLSFAQTGTIQIGSGTGTTSGSAAIPVSNYVYNYNQQIITAAEFAAGGGAPGNITKIRYKATSLGTLSVWNDWTVYIGHTTKTEFTSTTDWVPLSNLTQVFSGIITPDPIADNWFEITFNAPFNYTGGNLVVAVDENTPDWTTAPTFAAYTSTANKGIYYRNDTTNPDPLTPPTATGRVSLVAQIQFEGTLASCTPPNNLVANNITTTTADLGWSETGTATLWDIEWGVSGFSPTGSPTISGATSTTQPISGLTSGNAYSFYVRANCGANGFSAWAGPYTFTTPLLVAPPVMEGFATTATPAGWTTTGWLIGTARGVTGNPGNNIYKNLWSSAPTGTFTSVTVGPVTSDMIFSFDYIVANYGTPFGPPPVGSGNFVLEVSTNFGATYTVVETVPNNGVAGWQSKVYPLTAFAGQNVRFRITGNWISGDYDLAFDNFVVEIPPACLVASDVVFSNILPNGANASWTASPDETNGYNWVVMNDGDIPGTDIPAASGSTATGITNASFTGLTALTSYDFYVQTNCGVANGLSDWLGPNAFTTAADCSIYNLSVTATGGGVCDEGSVTLTATSSGTGSDIFWYDAPVNGTMVGLGATYETPFLTQTTSYWAAEVVTSGAALSGQGTPTYSGTLSTTTNGGIIMNVTDTFILIDAEVYSTSAAGGDMLVELRDINNGNATVGSTLVTMPAGGTTALPIPVTVPLNFVVTPGNYRLVKVSGPTFIYQSGSWPQPLGTSGNVTGGATLTGTSTLQYIFYNLTILEGEVLCESTRDEAIATVYDTIPVEASATQTSINPGTSTTLNATSTNSNYIYTWEPAASIAGSNIGATVTTANLNVNTTFTVTAEDSVTGCIATDEITILVFNTALCNDLDIISVDGAFICDEGTAILSATAAGISGDEVYWYDSAVGGTKVGIGATFETPILTQTTSYWAAEVLEDGDTFTGAARVLPASTLAGFSTTLAYGVVFDAYDAFTINTVDIYPTSTTTAGQITLELRDNTGATLQTVGPISYPVGTGNYPAATAVPITINIDVPGPGTGYRLVSTNVTAPLVRDSSNGGNPHPIATLGEVTAGWASTSVSVGTYYFFYNWTVSTAISLCESNREEVIATVVPTIPVEASATATQINPGNSTTLTATSTNTNYNYVWTWDGGTDTGASILVTPADHTTYTVTATDSITGCVATDEITILVFNTALCNTLDITTVTGGYVCDEGTTILSATASGTGDEIYWYDGEFAGNFLGKGLSFETPSISATTSYWAAEALLEITPLTGQAFANPTVFTNSVSNAGGLLFTVTSPINIVDVQVFKTNSTDGDVVIELRDIDNGNAIIATTTANITGAGTAASPIPHTIPLNFAVPAAGNYRLVRSGATPTGVGMGYVTAANSNFPYPLGTSGEVTGGSSLVGTSTLQFFFFNWTIEEIQFLCESPREEVIATVVDIDEVEATATATQINPNTSTTLTAVSTNTNYVYSWEPAASISGSNVGASVTTTNLTDHTTFTVTAIDTVTGCETTDEITILVFNTSLCNPLDITATTGDTICNGETANLSATASGTGSVIYWYDDEFGGNMVGEGATFETPALTATTSYWAAEVLTQGSSDFVGPLNPSIGATSNSNIAIGTQRMFFNVTSATTIVSVDIYPAAAIGSNGSIVIRDNTQQVLYDIPYTTTVTGGAVQTIMLNASLSAGTAYEMGQGTALSLARNTTGAVYPYTSPNVQITGNTFDPVYYYFFYNWEVGGTIFLCESDREEAIATVTSDDAPIGNLNQNFITGETLADLDVTGVNLTWYTDASGTIVLPDTTPLVDGMTYCVSQTVNGCESQLLCITVTLIQPCDAPTALTQVNVTSSSVQVSWTASASETGGYAWYVFADGANPLTDPSLFNGTVATGITTVTVAGLTASTDYDFYVSTLCNAGVESALAGPLNFTTNAIVCNPPTALTIVDVTDTTAEISWTASANETGGYAWYVFADGDNPLTDPSLFDGTVATGITTVTITGLTAATDYDVYVSTLCNAGIESALAGPLNVLTDAVVGCPVVNTFPFLENFEASSSTLSCWSQIREVGTSDWTFATGSSGGTITTAFSGTQNARFVSLSGTNNPITKLVSPVFDLSGLSNPELSFYYGQEVWAGDQNELKVYYRVSAMDPWVQIAHYTQNVASWTQVSLALPNPTATYQLAFEGINNWGRANVIDDVVIEEGVASCVAPTALTLNAVTDTTADLSWTASPDETGGYNWLLMNVGDDPLTDIPVDSGSVGTGITTVNLTGLDDDTSYDFYVQTVCTGTESSWAGPLNFTTDVSVAVFPAPYCGPITFTFDVEPITNVAVAGINNASSNVINGSPAHEDFTLVVGTMEQGGTYTIALQGNTGGNWTNHFTVFIDWNQNDVLDDAGEIYQIGSITNSNGIDGQQAIGTITVPAGAVLGETRMRVFKNYNVSVTNPCVGTGFGQVEDYTIDVVVQGPVCPMPLALNLDTVTATTIDFSWTPPTDLSDVDGYFWRLMNEGDDPLVDTPVDEAYVPGATSTSASIIGLTPGTDYDLYLVTVCDEITLFISDPLMITITTMLSVNDFDFNSIAFYPNPMVDVVNISAQIEIEKVVIFSLTGQKLIEQRVGNTVTQIDVSNFASGPYLIQVTTSTGKTGIFRLIKK